MRMFAKSIFKMGQPVPENEKTDPSGYLQGRTAITNAVHDTTNNLKTKFVPEKKDGPLQTQIQKIEVGRMYLPEREEIARRL